jgi:hypothetical protein
VPATLAILFCASVRHIANLTTRVRTVVSPSSSSWGRVFLYIRKLFGWGIAFEKVLGVPRILATPPPLRLAYSTSARHAADFQECTTSSIYKTRYAYGKIKKTFLKRTISILEVFSKQKQSPMFVSRLASSASNRYLNLSCIKITQSSERLARLWFISAEAGL